MKYVRNPHPHLLMIVVGLAVGLGVPGELRSQEKSAGQMAGTVYAVDTKVSRVYMRVEPDGRGHAHALVGWFTSGTVATEARGEIGELVVDLTSFAADGPKARQYVGLEGDISGPERFRVTRAMRGPDVLDTEQYPTAIFTVTSIVPLDKQSPGEPGSYQVEGKLDLHGVSRPVRFQTVAEYTETKNGFRVRVHGRCSLVQTNYGITPYSALFGAFKVKDEVRVDWDVFFALNPTK